MSVTMNTDTDYVHTHVVNFEPTWLVLANCVAAWQEDTTAPMAVYRDILRDEVERHREAMGLNPEHLTDDVDYAVMIQFEANE